MQFDDIGFLTFAQNTPSVNYLELAYLQALNVRATNPKFQYAVIVDMYTNSLVTDKHKKVFDHIIPVQQDYNHPDSAWKLANECQCYELSPFAETIKLESDLLFTGSIEHWLTAFRFNHVVLSTGAKTYHNTLSSNRAYRKFFDDNLLPDIYNGIMYFRRGPLAFEFFKLAEQILMEWDVIKEQAVKNCREDTPSTDVLYAVTAQIFGLENCTLPSFDFINFVHLKPQTQGWNIDSPWYEAIMYEQDGDIIRINNLNQYGPVHYHDKGFASEQLIKYYEHRVGIN